VSTPLLPHDADAGDESQLVQRLRNGEEAAFDAVYDQYAEALLRFVARYTSSPAIAQDVVADTFAHLWDRRATLAPRFGLKAYLFAAAQFRMRTTFRHNGRVRRMLDRFIREPAGASTDIHVDDVLEIQDITAQLRHAIAKLPKDRRQLIALRWYDGLTVPQIAHVLNLSVGAVEQRLVRILRELRRHVDAGNLRGS